SLFEKNINGAAEKVANKIIQKAFGKEIMKKFAKDELKEMIVEMLVQKSEAIVKIIVSDCIKIASGKKPPVTWEDFFDEVAGQFSKNEIFWSAVETKLEFKKGRSIRLKY